MARLLLVLMAFSFAFPAWSRTDLVDAAGNAIYSDVTTASTLVTVGNSLTTTVRGQSVATVNVSAITGTTATFEISNDGTNYTGVLCAVPGTSVTALTTTTTGFFWCPITGATNFRVRAVGGTSFTASMNTAQGTISGMGSRAFLVGATGVVLDAATGAAVPANGLLSAGRAATANPTNATGGNLTGVMVDKAGRIVTTPVHVRELAGKTLTTIAAASTAETTIVASGGASVFRDLCGLVVTTTNAAAATLTIKEATGGANVFILNYPNAAAVPSTPLVLNFSPCIPQAAAANNWTATPSANANGINITAVWASNL